MGVIDKDSSWQPPDFNSKQESPSDFQFGDIKPTEKSPYEGAGVPSEPPASNIVQTPQETKPKFEVAEFKPVQPKTVEPIPVKDTLKPAETTDFAPRQEINTPITTATEPTISQPVQATVPAASAPVQQILPPEPPKPDRYKEYQRLDFSHEDINRRSSQQLSMAMAGAAVAREANRDNYAPQYYPQQNMGYPPNNQYSNQYNNPQIGQQPYGNGYPNNQGMQQNPYNIPSWGGNNGGQGTLISMTKNSRMLEDAKVLWFSITISAIIFVWLSIYIVVMTGQLLFDKTITLPPELTSDLSNLVTFIMGGILALVTDSKPNVTTTTKKEEPNQSNSNKEIDAQ